jgi:selenocysteine-specific translation elongation factor
LSSINFVILGDTSIAGELGKKGTSSDITIHDRKTNENIISYCFANTYPEKLQPLLQSVAMADYAIINISKLDSFLGEQIVAAETLGIKKGFILHSYEVDPEKIKNIVKDTGLSSFEILGSVEELKTKISEMKPGEDKVGKSDDEEQQQSSNACVVVDHAFDVKGVGTVILGTVKQGQIKTYDELVLSPDNKSILVKSIQMHDDPVTISKRPSRVGLAIKGVSAKDVSRGDIITNQGLAKIANTDFHIKFVKNKYFKEEISETQNYMISIGLQIRTVKVKQLADDVLQITFEKPVAYLENEKCILFRPDSKGMRIMGYGFLK